MSSIPRGDSDRQSPNEPTYTVGSLFSGIGGIDLAFAAVGFDVRWQVEIDPYCQKVLRKHAPTYWPNAQLHSDIYDCHDLPHVDVIVAGFPCFAAGTLILTRSGYKPIEDVQVGDEVLTHMRRWRRVTSVMSREGARLRRVRAQGTTNIITTDEHPFYARKRGSQSEGCLTRGSRSFGDAEWVNAEQLGNAYYIGQTLPESVSDDHANSFWWLVGRYLADGWRVRRKNRKNSGRVVICCASNETDALSWHIQQAGFHATVVRERTVTKFHIVRNGFFHFLEAFGAYAHGKTLPGFALELPQEKARALLDGYLSGDGYREPTYWTATTISKALALSVALLAQRAYGVVASIGWNELPKTTTIEGRVVNQRGFWKVRIPFNNRSAFIDGDYGWKFVRHCEPFGIGKVYNVSVEDDESYIADGAIVHNCQPFSLAGKRLGVNDDRYLVPELFRVIEEVRPYAALFENVPGFTSIDDGNTFAEFLRALAEMGYDAEWGRVYASGVGAPHKRERWVCVAYRESIEFNRHVLSRRGGLGLANGGQALAYRDGAGMEGRSQAGNAGRKGSRSNQYATRRNQARRRLARATQCRLGGTADGLSAWLDGHRWPAGLGHDQHDYEPPRVVTGAKNRTPRIKALGNSVVPQVVLPIAQAVREYLDAQAREGGAE